MALPFHCCDTIYKGCFHWFWFSSTRCEGELQHKSIEVNGASCISLHSRVAGSTAVQENTVKGLQCWISPLILRICEDLEILETCHHFVKWEYLFDKRYYLIVQNMSCLFNRCAKSSLSNLLLSVMPRYYCFSLFLMLLVFLELALYNWW